MRRRSPKRQSTRKPFCAAALPLVLRDNLSTPSHLYSASGCYFRSKHLCAGIPAGRRWRPGGGGGGRGGQASPCKHLRAGISVQTPPCRHLRADTSVQTSPPRHLRADASMQTSPCRHLRPDMSVQTFRCKRFQADTSMQTSPCRHLRASTSVQTSPCRYLRAKSSARASLREHPHSGMATFYTQYQDICTCPFSSSIVLGPSV